MAEETLFMLYALLMGIFITFVYDLLRILRRQLACEGQMRCTSKGYQFPHGHMNAGKILRKTCHTVCPFIGRKGTNFLTVQQDGACIVLLFPCQAGDQGGLA